jgi:hypothetical protein
MTPVLMGNVLEQAGSVMIPYSERAQKAATKLPLNVRAAVIPVRRSLPVMKIRVSAIVLPLIREMAQVFGAQPITR